MSSSTGHDPGNKRSASRSRQPTSRPTTPLRSTSRSSLRDSQNAALNIDPSQGPASRLDAYEPAFAELSDSMADLEANFMHLQLMHESLSRFSESFASFLYGLNMNAFCVDFPEAPVMESFKRMKSQAQAEAERARFESDADTSFMTTDTSFVENPPQSSKASLKYTTPRAKPRYRGAASRANMSGIARGPSTSTRGARASGVARTRGRAVS
ncbi:MAG: DASH complex subunit dam1 [Vezdaea aestivalis]|nr:MAG: DASH complex subunit dam1 [Vezdaea aestivalis]